MGLKSREGEGEEDEQFERMSLDCGSFSKTDVCQRSLGSPDFATIVGIATLGFFYKQWSAANSQDLGTKMILSDQQDD